MEFPSASCESVKIMWKTDDRWSSSHSCFFWKSENATLSKYVCTFLISQINKLCLLCKTHPQSSIITTMMGQIEEAIRLNFAHKIFLIGTQCNTNFFLSLARFHVYIHLTSSFCPFFASVDRATAILDGKHPQKHTFCQFCR